MSRQAGLLREAGVGEGKLLRAPRRLGNPAITQKYKVHQNVSFLMEKFKQISQERPRKNVSSGPADAVTLNGPAAKHC